MPPDERQRRQLLEGADVEDLAHHCGAAEHRTLVGAETLETRRQERVDPGRDVHRLEVAHGDPAAVHLHEPPVVDEHRDHLLDEQRIAFGPGRNVIPDVQGGLGLAEQLGDQTVAGRVVQRLEPHHGASAGALAPVRTPLEEVWPADAEQEDRDGLRVTRHVLDQREERRLGPMSVVEHDDERARICQAREEPPHGPEALLDDPSRFQEPGEVGDRLGDRTSVVSRRQQRLQLGDRLVRPVTLADCRLPP